MTSSTTAETLPPLPDIDEVRPYGPADDACFDELREVLERHGALNRFGITLLHQHFDVGDDEILLESIDKTNRILTSAPVQNESAGNSVETSWRLSTKKTQRKCETKCRTAKNAEGEDYHLGQHYTVS